MKYYSTNNPPSHKATEGKKISVTFREALLRGLAEDGGLYMPALLGKLQIPNSKSQNFSELAFEIARNFIDDIPEAELREIINDAFSVDAFGSELGTPAPLIKLNENLYVLELWHGPTLAFKEF